MAIANDESGVSDNVGIEVKGPDPKVWGSEKKRREADAADGKTDVAPDGVHVKGPDPEVWG